MDVSVVGLGKLGATLAGVLASKRHTITGVDINEYFVARINAGESPIAEPGLAELLRSSRERLSATMDYQEAIDRTEITFVIVPTPSDENGAFSLRYVLNACEAIGKSLARKQKYHLVVITSTVMPGSMQQEIQPCLERASGKRCGHDFGLCYNPEFIALGSVIHDMLNPDFLLIGESEPRAGELLTALYRTICAREVPVQRMNFINAELTKLAVNTYVTMKISYANMLAQVCERLEGADASVVNRAIGCDSRIGAKYLRGALSYGGPCFPRDNLAFNHLARMVGVDALLAKATDEINHMQMMHLANLVLSCRSSGGAVGILGLSYKPGTNVTERSPGLELAQYLLSQGIAVKVYDPIALDTARGQLAGNICFASSVDECAQQVDVLVVATAWNEFEKLSPAALRQHSGQTTIIDCWRVLDEASFSEAANYLVPGRYHKLPIHLSE